MTAARSCSRICRGIFIAIAALLLADIVLFATLPLRTLMPEEIDDGQQPVDVAAILFGGFSESRDGVNDETGRRLNHGMSLLKNNRARLLMVVGGNRGDSRKNGALLMAEFLRDQGIAAGQVLIEDRSLDSVSNLERIAVLMQGYDLESAGLVSSSHHLLRIRALDTPKGEDLSYSYLPYPVDTCTPPARRAEIWVSAHSNLAAWLAAVLLPPKMYDRLILWVRTHTDF